MPVKATRYYPCPRCGENTLRKNGTARGAGGKRVQRYACEKNGVVCYTTRHPESPVALNPNGTSDGPAKNPQFKRPLGGVKRFVITAAQNSTPVHRPFLSALLAYCEANDAELVVIPLRYKNPTSRWTESQTNEERWSPLLEPYLYNQRKKLNDNLVLLGDIKTVPTAVRPLSGFESITHGESGILGHTKLQLETIPTPQGNYPKILTTTGAVTIPNYTDSKAGKKGEFHHTLGAVAVEISGKKFHMRQINATKDGSFIDLDRHYLSVEDTIPAHKALWFDRNDVQAGIVEPAAPALGIAFGDTHRQVMDRTVERATFGKGGIVETLNPEYLVFHDLHDGYAENPHNDKNPFVKLAKRRSLKHDVAKEVHEDVAWLERTVGDRKAIIVGSNHDNFLSRWVVNTDWRTDVDNAEFYLETALQMARSARMTDTGAAYADPFQHWIERLKSGKVDIRCLKVDESFMLADIEMGLHGDRGPNGARGSRMNLRRIGVKTIIGHAHSPGIEEGCYQTGTSTPLRLEYTGGPSSWLHTHVVVYANGKRSLISIIDGEWRL